MAKRFTDTDLWDKEWFMNLPPKLKCLVKYVRDKCDIAGFWSPNWRLASMHIGEDVTETDLLSIDYGQQFEKTPDGKISCIGFINFQYGETLSEKSPVHRKVQAILEKNKGTLEKTLFDTEQTFKNGLIEEENVEQLKITLSSINSSLNYTKRLKDISYNMLKINLGIELEEELSLTDKLENLTNSNLDMANSSFNLSPSGVNVFGT